MTQLLQSGIFILIVTASVWASNFDFNNNAITRVEEINYRLDMSVLPLHYNLSFKPYLREEDGDKIFTFDGEAYIQINVTESLHSKITLHSKNLNYTQYKLYETKNPANIIDITMLNSDPTTDKMSLHLNTTLNKGTDYTLHFVYSGKMDDDMTGFYQSKYEDANGNTKWLGSTQFETHHARRAFPCFDEPKFKASFKVHINRHKGFNTVSNTEIESIIKAPEMNRFIDVYTTTPPMSTYLLAFLVSDFVSRSNLDGDFFVIARPEFYSQTGFAHDVGPKLLDAFGKFTNLTYEFIGNPKMHLAGIPDFDAGAMENWGLLTFRERALLFDNNSSSLSSKQSIASIVSHEIAHMWFGDYVTCDWWSWTWLNEGFARHYQYFMTHEVHPELEMDKQFAVDQMQTVFAMDSTNSTNPMSDLNTNTPSDLSRMFNSISYNKGGSIIRMVRHAMGEDNFKKSLQEYLRINGHKNTKPEDLFKHWKDNWPDVNVDLDILLKGWTEQVGYPLITVNVSKTEMSLRQNRFLINENDTLSNETLLYIVPFTFTTNIEKDFKNTTPSLYLKNTSEEEKVVLKNVSWVIANIQQTGYYRVNYNQENWQAIHLALAAVNHSGIHEINRAQIVDDLLNLARAGKIQYALAFQCLDYLRNEMNYLPWTSTLNGLTYLGIRLGLENKQSFGQYILYIMENVYGQLGFNEKQQDSTLDIYNRNKIISWACKYGNADCIAQSKKIFKSLIDNNTPVPVNIRSAVYCSAMREGNQNDFQALFNKFLKETVATEQTLLLNVLGCVKDKTLVENYFNQIMTDNIRRQDKSAALSSLYSENPENVDPVYKLVTENCDELAKAMGGIGNVATVISNIASRFTSEEQKKSLVDFIFLNGSKFGNSVSTLERAVLTVEENLNWSSKKLPSIIEFLETKRNGVASKTTNFLLVSLLAIITYIVNSLQ